MTEKQFLKAAAAWERACETTPRNDDGSVMINGDGELLVDMTTYGMERMREIYEVLREWYGDAK